VAIRVPLSSVVWRLRGTVLRFFFFFQAEDGIRDFHVTGVQTCLFRSYFRAPVGMKNPAVHPLLASRAMLLIGWTARGFDTVRARSEERRVGKDCRWRGGRERGRKKGRDRRWAEQE